MSVGVRRLLLAQQRLQREDWHTRRLHLLLYQGHPLEDLIIASAKLGFVFRADLGQMLPKLDLREDAVLIHARAFRACRLRHLALQLEPLRPDVRVALAQLSVGGAALEHAGPVSALGLRLHVPVDKRLALILAQRAQARQLCLNRSLGLSLRCAVICKDRFVKGRRARWRDERRGGWCLRMVMYRDWRRGHTLPLLDVKFGWRDLGHSCACFLSGPSVASARTEN
eukprot:scaffold12093_cov137-Isochrysis_galbana.AAC.5